MKHLRKSIPSHPAYSVDADGNVYGKAGRRLRIFPDKRGYLRFTTYEAGRWQQVSVHVMVCEAFHGPRPEGHHAAHRNGIHIDNRASNLRWSTPTENEADKLDHGRRMQGETHHQCKLAESDVLEIRKRQESVKVQAERYGVSVWTIRAIRYRRLWRHLP